jgi:hypothetical protein
MVLLSECGGKSAWQRYFCAVQTGGRAAGCKPMRQRFRYLGGMGGMGGALA